MEVLQHFNGEVAGNRPSGLRPQPDDDAAIATAVSNIITDVVKNGEIAKEESCLEHQTAEFCNNGNAEDEEEEEKELNLERNKQRRRRVYLDKNLPESIKAGDHHDDGDIKTSAEIGNVAEIHSLVNAALRGDTKDVHGSSREDEVIELEFFDSRAADKLRSTHDAYCPHCRNPISKVVLRIRRGAPVGPLPAPEPAEKDLDLLGCLSCFKIFLPSRVAAADGEKSTDGRAGVQQESKSASHNGKCFGFLDWIYDGQRSTTTNSNTSQKQLSDSESCSSGQGKKKPVEEHLRGDGDCLVQSASTPLLQGIQTPSPADLNGNAAAIKHEPHYLGKPSAETHLGLEERHSSSGREVHIPIEESTNEARALTTTTQGPTVESGRRGSSSIEVVKSVVYGGLVEAIASLTLVSSAAASGATTLRVFTIGVANLIGGLVIMAHNFMDLYKNHPASEYQEVLGQKKHFLLHVIVALLSYLIFGLAPPVIYGFTFREGDDRDSKLLAVAVASFVFIVLLSIAKAYTQRGANTFKEYSLTVLQYAVTAAMASGVSYVVGDLFGKMMDELGWYNSTPPNVVLPSTHPSWVSY
ncbi:unnamed protein product [Cuscuta campestris]|uniref:Membrane protein of ER body-like protein n=1 Tax=Cuscuta campestris TaxID=132261 RepID=A0A484N520_9ASTE|nr:unnamed protein product [Cuscuta campestris]